MTGPPGPVAWTATGGTITAAGVYTAGSVTGTFQVRAALNGGAIGFNAPVVIGGSPVSTSYLSDRAWTSMTNGWGSAEKDRSNGDLAVGDGLALALNEVTYAKGLGAHAPSDIRYALGGACSTFRAVVGLDDEVGPAGTVGFQVWLDNVKQFDSGVMTGAMPGLAVNVSVAGAQELTLVVTDGGDGAISDHGDWADVQVSCRADTTNSSQTVTVTPATVTIAGGSSQQFTALVAGTASSAVVWSATGGTITAGGRFTAGSVNGAYTVRAGLNGGTGSGTAQAQIISAPTGAAIRPGDDIQARVAAAPAGTAFLLTAGLYRMQTISPKDGDTFSGEPGTVLSGARLLAAFSQTGNYWTVDGQTQQGMVHGECFDGYPRCGYPEQLFIDDQLVTNVGRLADVRAGTWFFDYDQDRIYMGDNPTGRRVETSITTTAFANTGNNVTISNLTVEKYANPAQYGPINAENTSGWVITQNDIRWNHGGGIRIGTGARIVGNLVHHNGQMGIVGIGDDVLVESNEISYNNQAHFAPGWEAGGTKFVLTNRLIVRGNFVHHNIGPGLWSDIDNINTLYENNTVEDNEQIGIFHEISYAATIRNNIVRRNGFGLWVPANYIWGAGILVAASPDVEIYGNTVQGNNGGIAAVQQERGSGTYGPHQIANLNVHDNDSTVTTGWTGLVVDTGDNSYFTSRNNRFQANDYTLGTSDNYFVWMNAARTTAAWTGFGLDVGGTFTH